MKAISSRFWRFALINLIGIVAVAIAAVAVPAGVVHWPAGHRRDNYTRTPDQRAYDRNGPIAEGARYG